MQEPKSVTVTIYGQAYTLKGGADSEYVQELAAFVDERMHEVSENSPVGSTAKVAILAAVNMADELFREQQKRIETMATLEDRSVQIARLLGREMGIKDASAELLEKEENQAATDQDISKDFSSSDKRDSLPGA